MLVTNPFPYYECTFFSFGIKIVLNITKITLKIFIRPLLIYTLKLSIYFIFFIRANLTILYRRELDKNVLLYTLGQFDPKSNLCSCVQH